MADDIAEVNKFLERMKEGDFTFTAKATELKYIYGYQPYDTSFEKARKTKPLAVCLDVDLAKFKEAKNLATKKLLAKNCLSWIQTMWLSGAITESTQLPRKVEALRESNEQLQKDLAQLSEKYLSVQGELDNLKLITNIKSVDDWRKEET